MISETSVILDHCRPNAEANCGARAAFYGLLAGAFIEEPRDRLFGGLA